MASTTIRKILLAVAPVLLIGVSVVLYVMSGMNNRIGNASNEDSTGSSPAIFRLGALPCIPAGDVKMRMLGPKRTIGLPEKLAKNTVIGQPYLPPWIDSRSLPSALDQLRFDTPEDVDLAFVGATELRRSESWLKSCITQETYDYRKRYQEQDHSATPQESLQQVQDQTSPLRYWYRVEIETESGDTFCVTYFDCLMDEMRGEEGPGDYGPLSAFAYKKTPEGWKRSFEFEDTDVGRYLFTEFPKQELPRLLPANPRE